MNHAAAQNLEPILTFAETDFAAFAPALDVDFHGRLGERKERGTKAHLHGRHFEERLAEFLKNPFQVPEMGAAIDNQPLDLVELRRMRLIRIDAIRAPWTDDADRRLL